MTVTLATARTDIYQVLEDLGTANTYRRRQTDYEFPAFVVGWPESLDFRPAMAGARDFVINVDVAVEVSDDSSSDDRLSELLEGAVEALLVATNWDVRPATDFGEALDSAGRVIIWCRLPVAVFE
jgi:hypothetical protein